MLPAELKPDCASIQTIYVTLEMQLGVNPQTLAPSVHVIKGLNTSQKPSKLVLLEKEMNGFAEVEFHVVS
jgi:hypothetical protein